MMDELQHYKVNFGQFQKQIEAMENALVAVGIQMPIPQFSGIHLCMLRIHFVKTC